MLILVFAVLFALAGFASAEYKVLVIASDNYTESGGEIDYITSLTTIEGYNFSYEVLKINPNEGNRGWADAIDLSTLSEAEIKDTLSQTDILFFTWNGPGHDGAYLMKGTENAVREWVQNGGVVWMDAFDDNFKDDQGNYIGLWFPVDEYPAQIANTGDSDVEVTPEGEASGLFSKPNTVDVNALTLDDNFAGDLTGYTILANRADGKGAAAIQLAYGAGYYVGMCIDTRDAGRVEAAKPLIENALYYCAKLKSSVTAVEPSDKLSTTWGEIKK